MLADRSDAALRVGLELCPRPRGISGQMKYLRK